MLRAFDDAVAALGYVGCDGGASINRDEWPEVVGADVGLVFFRVKLPLAVDPAVLCERVAATRCVGRGAGVVHDATVQPLFALAVKRVGYHHDAAVPTHKPTTRQRQMREAQVLRRCVSPWVG